MRHFGSPEPDPDRRPVREATGAVRPRQRARAALGGPRRHALHAGGPAGAARRPGQAGQHRGHLGGGLPGGLDRRRAAGRGRGERGRRRCARCTRSTRPSCRCCSCGCVRWPSCPRWSPGWARPARCWTGSCCPSSPRPSAPSTCTRWTRPTARAGKLFLAMPVIESGAALYAETRGDELTRLRALLHRDRRRILAVRLGRHRPVRAVRSAPLAGPVDLRREGGQRADRRRGERAGPGRRHRVHRDRAGMGVLRRRRTHLPHPAAGVARSTSTTRPSCAGSWCPGPSTG